VPSHFNWTLLLYNIEDVAKCRLLCTNSQVSQSMSRELLSPDHPHYYIITLLIERLTFHIFHPHRHTSVTNCQTVSPYASLMPLPSINKHYRGHGPPPIVREAAHLPTVISTSYPLTGYVKQLTTPVAAGRYKHSDKLKGTVVTAVRSVILREKPRNGLVGSLEILSAFLAEAICINRASLSVRNLLNGQVTYHHL
jgi:hypothetical protein